jgi:hypothetical protein
VSTKAKDYDEDEKPKAATKGVGAKEEIKEQPKEKEIAVAKEEKKFKCSSCKDASFDTNQEFRTHFKTDWHNFNNKRKIDVRDIFRGFGLILM